MDRYVIGITGATGILYGIKILECLREIKNVETHLVLSKPALQTMSYETEWTFKNVKKLANYVYANQDIGASIASGSFLTKGMIIAPCSIHTLSAVAYCNSGNLIARAADVTLKERRPLILMVRETPLHQGHLECMLKVTQMGGIIAPPAPVFYTHPQSINELMAHSVGRILDLLGLEHPLMPRWEGENRKKFLKPLRHSG
ncbi:UbiX family flavin prenyltransferase [Deltaproteobacteria bacterium TL4]